MGLDDAACDVQAEPRGGLVLAVHEAVEDPFAVRGRDAGPVVLDGDQRPARVVAQAADHVLATVPQGVGQQV